MRVAILHNPRPASCEDADDDAFEEYDGPQTIAAIAAALAAAGVEPVPLAADPGYPWRLNDGAFDLVFNIAEGTGGRCREAVPAAVCECLGLGYTGSDPLTLAVTLDKSVARRIVSPEVPVAPAVLVRDEADEAALAQLPYPAIAKPNHEGSSKGIRHDAVCADADAARSRCRALRERYAGPVLVETFLGGPEVTAAVRGNGRDAALIGLMEVAAADARAADRFVYDLEAKRDWRAQVRYHVPPRLPGGERERIAALALQAYRQLGCRDIARLDFRLDAHGVPHFLECNPLPGLNPESGDLVILARAVSDEPHTAHRRLVQGILHDALRRLGRSLPR
jgi:D-alanine-D-alanine ligase